MTARRRDRPTAASTVRGERDRAVPPARNAAPSTAVSLDTLDFRILDELQRDARLTNVELAARVGLSPSPCLARVRALETAGVIQGYVTLVAPEAVGSGVTAFVDVRLRGHDATTLDAFERAVGRVPQVVDCHRLVGIADYRLRVVVSDVGAYERLIADALHAEPSVASIDAQFVLRTVKRETALPLVAQDGPPGNGRTARARPARGIARS
jgi:Lrp/AsnC family leucine-responsive transcriptional regulator